MSSTPDMLPDDLIVPDDMIWFFHRQDSEQATGFSVRYSDMPKRRPTPLELLSEQQGWAVYTNEAHNRFGRDANMLVHLACNRHFPNWWLAPDLLGSAEKDPGLYCDTCKEHLPLKVYHIFWGAYRLLNMKKTYDGDLYRR